MHNLSNNQKSELLILLNKMGHDSMWKIDAVIKWLGKLGIESECNTDKTTLYLFNQSINVTEPEWGDAGIHAPSIAYIIAKIENIDCQSNYTGSGFQFRELLDRISLKWNLDERFS